jgi:D-glycero-alpha-D-manno-heptose-7-phosphate kinase
MIVRARAPLRLGLAGGGTDVSPYAELHGGYVLNATIDRYAYSTIKLLNEPLIRFVASDQQQEQTIRITDEILLDGYLDLHKSVYKYMIENYNNSKPISLEVTTFCDAPPGSGLGSSSTLVVAMIRSFVELLNIPIDDYFVAQLAFKLERIDCGFQGGRQDQYSATFGGFNFMEFYADNRVIVNPLRIKNWIICELEASLVLFYTGVSRESSAIIKDQSDNVKTGVQDAIEAMHGLKCEAVKMKEGLLRGDFKDIVKSLQHGWENKKRSAKKVSNPLIDSVYAAAIEAGALAGKASGAGGGGFLLFFVPVELRMNVIRALNQFEGQVSNCHFTKYGSQSWRMSSGCISV